VTCAAARAFGTPASTATSIDPISAPHEPGAVPAGGAVVAVAGAVAPGAVTPGGSVVVVGAVVLGAGVVVVEVTVPGAGPAAPSPSSRVATKTTIPAPTSAISATPATIHARATAPVSRPPRRGWLHSSPIDPDLVLALELADAADRIALARFRASDLVVDTKPDMTPVTEADRAVEASLRAQLARARPSDGVVGEEFGATGGPEAGRRWIVDPIDGTKNYARGVPVWATLIALERDHQLSVGVVSAPALGSRWWATREAGAFRDGDPVRVSKVARLEDAHLSYDAPEHFEAVGRDSAFFALARRCWRTRGFGDFWPYVMVADGSIDIAIEPEGLAVWDLAGPMVIVEAAGGRFTDIEGVARADGGSAVATNGLLHDDVLAALAP
jgi:histidinol-phosphatase